MDKYRWTGAPKYRRWVKARDKALEDLHTRAQIETTDIIRHMLGQALMAAQSHFHAIKVSPTFGIDQLDHQLKIAFSHAGGELVKILTTLRVRSYLLSKASEAEIIAQHLPSKSIVASANHGNLHAIRTRPSAAGGEVHQRVMHYMDKLRRKILTMAQASALNTDNVKDFLFDVRMAFPKARIVRQPKRILKPLLKEAAGDPSAEYAIDNIDDEAWNDMLGAYMNDYVPKSRAPEYVVDTTGMDITDPTVQADGTEVWYAWEFERDLTHEFVQSVRDGQVDAASDNGITDFVVIAIIDDKVCDDCCGDYGCADFDGQLVSEVEKMTNGDQSAPPYHFNCRCNLAPATDNIPDKPDDGAAEFDDWLMGA